MSKHKVLLSITASIAAYKSAYLISKLVQNSFEVQVAATDSTLNFIGAATLEGLTSKPVLTNLFEAGKMMNHINLIKWADIIVVCPASANTINKMANGIADNLVTSLFLAHTWDKPILIAPAMNTAMYKHPATQKSLRELEKMGVKVLPTIEGYLACGDVGEGKLLDPDLIYEYICQSLNESVKSKAGSVLITSGATRESIDGVRFISNISTGRTAASIAKHLIKQHYDITFLHGVNSLKPEFGSNNLQFSDFRSLEEKLKQLLSNNHYDYVIHAAAVSDYIIDEIQTGRKSISASNIMKINSGIDTLTLKLKPTYKLLNKLKDFSLNKKVKVFGFKFSAEKDIKNSKLQVNKLFASSNADFVILNHLTDRDNEGQQNNFYIYDQKKLIYKAERPENLAVEIEKLFTN